MDIEMTEQRIENLRMIRELKIASKDTDMWDTIERFYTSGRYKEMYQLLVIVAKEIVENTP